MKHYEPIEMVDQLRTWVEKCFQSLNSIPSDEANKNEARARYREVKKLINLHEKLNLPISTEIASEKTTLEEYLNASNEEESKLTSLANELSELASDINRLLRDTRNQKIMRGEKGPPKRLRVEFHDDGTIICENKATDTFVKSIQHIGLEDVSQLQSIRCRGYPLVSTQKNESKGSKKYIIRELDGFFIHTQLGTKVKARYIQAIARELGIEISVEVIE